MSRIAIVASLSAILSVQAAASCNFGAVDYQNCLYREQMNSVPNPSATSLSSRPNPQGGYDYSNGVTCRRNPFGGLDCR